MTEQRLDRFWLLATFILTVIIIVSAVVIFVRYDRGSPIEIRESPQSPVKGQVYVEGAVKSPGLYDLKPGDGLETLIGNSGGFEKDADLSALRLYIPRSGEKAAAQLIDLNRADLPLLLSLPGIGEVRAQAIIDYRRRYGPFRDIHDLTNVPGIGESTFEKIKDDITVAP
jgi:competence protein ComEA